MSKFSDLMSKPLPSAANSVVTEGCGSCKEDSVTDPTMPSLDDTMPDPTDDLDTVAMPAVSDPIDDKPATPLSPEEDQHVDDVMNTVATPIMIQSEMTESEVADFVESADCDVVVGEGFLTERTIIKFDKNAKKAQLYEVAVAACAREHKDPLWKKLETVYKMERVLKAKLRKKYNAEATKKVKEYLARAKKSKSGILSRIANKIMGK